jgi:hypothetical protein
MDAQRKADLFRRGLDCFNHGEFFTCHELLEEIWLEEPEEEKPFYQGLIQVAAAFHHHQRGNPAGFESLLRAGTAKLRRFPPTYHGVDLAGLLSDLNLWLDTSEQRQPTEHLPIPSIKS